MTEITRENYHNINKIGDKPLVASSCLQYAYPGQGGSVARVGAYFDSQDSTEEDEKEKAHQQLGSLLHLYLEKPSSFVVEDGNRPDPWICELIQAARLRAPGGVQRMEDLKPFLYSTAQDLQIQPRWGEKAIIDNVAKDAGVAYFHFLVENNGKQMLSASVKEQLQGMQHAIEHSPWADVILNRKHPQAQVLSEFPLIWEYKGIPCKSMIDLPWIDRDRKKVRVNDFKTTSSPVGTFQYRTELIFNESGNLVEIRVPGAMYKYRYYRQTAFYQLAMMWWLKKLIPDADLREWDFTQGMFVVGSKAPHEVTYVEVPVQAAFQGKAEIDLCFDKTIIPYYKEKRLLSWN